MSQPKLTETTNDRLRSDGAHPSMPWPMMPRVEAAHEPLQGESFIPPPPVPSVAVEHKGPIPATGLNPLKIALVGTAPSSRMLAPFHDPSWLIWACSPGNQNVIPLPEGRITWFELHNNLLWPENRHYGEPYIKWLNEQKFPIYMQDNTVVPRAMVFPKEEMLGKFGRYFFTSSFAWMLALAIHEIDKLIAQGIGGHEIALFGIDMASRDEYILQRPGGHYFMQEAAKRGIRVSVPFESDLAQPPGLYGYSDATPFGRKLHAREQEIKQRIQQLTQQRDQANHSLTYLQGALEDIDYVKSIWMGLGG